MDNDDAGENGSSSEVPAGPQQRAGAGARLLLLRGAAQPGAGGSRQGGSQPSTGSR